MVGDQQETAGKEVMVVVVNKTGFESEDDVMEKLALEQAQASLSQQQSKQQPTSPHAEQQEALPDHERQLQPTAPPTPWPPPPVVPLTIEVRGGRRDR